MNLITNGEIYLKRMPKSLYKPIDEDLDGIEIISDTNEIEDTETGVDIDSIEGCLCFWTANVDDDMIHMTAQGFTPISNTERFFESKEEMDKEFISLVEYLAKAKFVGRRWRLPGFDELANFSNIHNDRTVLYEYDNMLLLQNSHADLGPMFEIFLRDPEALSINDRMICEINESAEIYRDKATTYKEIANYLVKHKRKGL